MLQPDISLINNTLRYIGCSDGQADEQMLLTVRKALDTVLTKADFKYRYCKIADLADTPTFLEKEAYASLRPFLNEAALFAATLGLGCDRAIQATTKTDLSQAVVINAAANVVLEHLADEKLNTLQPKGVLFCPGYSGSDIIDNKQILNYLDAQKLIGIYTTELGIMIPEKSLCGIVLNNYRFSCKNCFIQSKCDYIKKGTTCYNQ